MHPRTACTIIALAFMSSTVMAELKVPSIFSDHMVLQRDMPVPVWGWADPGAQVHVRLEGVPGASHRVRADKEGRWVIELTPMQASSSPRSLVIETVPTSRQYEPERITIDDVLVGEVWVCSGQSNMEWKLSWCQQENIDTSTADHDVIRMYTAQHVSLPEPQDDVVGSWVPCDAEHAPDLSAVAYYFGRDLQNHLDVPIGLVLVSWGGSAAEAWTTRETLESMPETRPIIDRFEGASVEDADASAFTSITHDDSDWSVAELPSMFKDQGHDIDGTIWYRRHIEIPERWKDRELELTLGPIDDEDITWFNGWVVGRTGNWQAPRNYAVPAELVKPGPGLLTIRVTDHQGPGGFVGTPEQMRIGPVDDPADRRSLAGSWVLQPSSRPHVRPMSANHRPSHLYNGMLHPVIPYAMRGVIWYQGESNVGRAAQYEILFQAMIEDWRAKWGQGDFPFYFVQIAPYNYGAPEACSELRESQAAALSLPNTGMVITMDVGNPKDIHPKAKIPVGNRLARMARSDVYGHDVLSRAPTYCCSELVDHEFILEMEGECLPLSTLDGEPPSHFLLAGDDHVFHPATAVIDGNTIRLSSDAVPYPVAARYAWTDDAEPNLAGGCGLPVGPFRTDEWPRVTDGLH